MLLSVDDFYRYLSRRYALTTAKNTVYRVGRLAAWLGGGLEKLLDQHHVVDFVLSKKASAGYRHNLLTAYIRFLRYAGEKPQPAVLEAIQSLERLRERKLPRIPSYTTAIAGLAALHGNTKVAYALGLFAGLRLNEALNLRWTQVDLPSRQIIMEKSEKKSEGSILPIVDQLHDILTEAKAKALNDYVCGGIGERTVQKTLRRLQRRIQTEDAKYLTFKNLRHIFATRLYATSKDLVYTQRMLRHRSILTTQRYVHMITTPRTYDVVVIDRDDHNKIAELLATGFDFVLQTKNKVYLRRPKGL